MAWTAPYTIRDTRDVHGSQTLLWLSWLKAILSMDESFLNRRALRGDTQHWLEVRF